MTNNEWKHKLDVYLVMGIEEVNGRSAVEIARQAIEGGVGTIQLREKKAPLRHVISVGKELRALCKQSEVMFVVNDRVDVALLLEADGVHVGQDDLPASETRKLVGKEMFIGVSASSIEEAEWAIDQGADYLGVGAIYATGSKDDAGEPVTPSLISEIRSFTNLPIVGIGGITAENTRKVIEHGANGVAVISAIVNQTHPGQAARRLKDIVAQSQG